MSAARKHLDVTLSLVLGLGCLIVYLLTLSRGAYPGASAHLIAEGVGLQPRITPDYPLWSAIAFLLGKLPGGDPSTAYNFFSAVCGATGVTLAYWVVRNGLMLYYRQEDVGKREVMLTRLAGLGCALALAFNTPYWVASTRAMRQNFHLCLFLAVSMVFLHAVRASRRTRWIPIFCFLCGLAIVEYASVALFLPIFALTLLYLTWKWEQLTPAYFAVLVGCGVLGLLLYVANAACFYGSDGYELREYPNFFTIIWYMWRDQWWQISGSIPKTGWLLMLILTSIPWFTGIMLSRRGMRDEQDWSLILLHIVLSGLAVSTLLNVPFAPWSMFGHTQLVILPYLLTASLFGYLLAYWYVTLSGDLGARLTVLRRMAPALPVIGLLFLAWLPFRNYSECDARGAASIRQYAREMVGALDGRSWLLSSGVIDSHLLIAAMERGIDLNTLNLRRAGDEIHTKIVARKLDDPRLESRMRIGLGAMVQEWLATDPAASQKIAVEAYPDGWLHAGYDPVPNRLLYFGSRDLAALDAVSMYESHVVFWERLEPALTTRKNRKEDPLAGYVNWMRRHAATVANNCGVLLEDLGDTERAAEAYAYSQRIDSNNVSALVNQLILSRTTGDTQMASELESKLSSFAESLSGRRLSAVARLYGYVRSPGTFADEGWSLAAAARPEKAIPALERAIDLLGDQQGANAIKQTLADVYRISGQDEESRMFYDELLVENPSNQRALLGMARLSIRDGEFDEARDYLDRAEGAGVPGSIMAMERSTFYLAKGDAMRAAELLTTLLDEKPGLERAWAMLAGIHIQLQNREELAGCLEKLRATGRRGATIPIVEGFLSLFDRQLTNAKHSFEESLSYNPNNIGVLEICIRLSVAQRDFRDAESHVRQLLSLEPDNALGNKVLAGIHASEGEYELARESLERLLSNERSPEALVNLAWVLQESGIYDEAEASVREALAKDDGRVDAWVVLGVIKVKSGAHKSAIKPLVKALELNENNIVAALHLIEAYAESGDVKSARALHQHWMEYESNLSPDTVDELDRLARLIED